MASALDYAHEQGIVHRDIKPDNVLLSPGRSPQAILAAQVTETPEAVQKLRSSLPPALAALIMRCLEKHAANRPQSAAEIVSALDALATPMPPRPQ